MLMVLLGSSRLTRGIVRSPLLLKQPWGGEGHAKARDAITFSCNRAGGIYDASPQRNLNRAPVGFAWSPDFHSGRFHPYGAATKPDNFFTRQPLVDKPNVTAPGVSILAGKQADSVRGESKLTLYGAGWTQVFGWDLGGTERTVIRGGAGIYYDRFSFDLPRGSFGGASFLGNREVPGRKPPQITGNLPIQSGALIQFGRPEARPPIKAFDRTMTSSRPWLTARSTVGRSGANSDW